MTYTKKNQVPSQDKWKHDKFENGHGHPHHERHETSGENRVATKVGIVGLHYDVSEEELKVCRMLMQELFEQIGSLAKGPFIKFDASGRSTGSATVWFDSESDAHRAVDEFDGAKAKGETIQVKALETGPLVLSRRTYGRGSHVASLADRLQDPHASIKHRNRRNRHREHDKRRAIPSAADLDKELEAFMNTASNDAEQRVCMAILQQQATPMEM